MTGGRRWTWRWTLLFWLGLSFAAWNGFFDILVRLGEKEYLLAQARYELGAGRRVTIEGIMRPAIHRAAALSSIWAGIIFFSGVGWTVYVRRRAVEPASPRK